MEDPAVAYDQLHTARIADFLSGFSLDPCRPPSFRSLRLFCDWIIIDIQSL